MQVAEIVNGESRGGAAAREQLAVARIRVDHVSLLRVKEVLEDEGDVSFVQVRRRFQAQLEETIAGMPSGERFELHQQ